MGQLEFPLPYWDNVSETAKVDTFILFAGFTSRKRPTDELLCFPAQGADQIHAGGGGGPEVLGPAGPGAPLGHCKCRAR